MITLKKQYAIGIGVQVVALSLFYYSEKSSGAFKLTPTDQKGVRQIALTISVAASTVVVAGHIRLLSRGVRYVFGKKVTK